MSIVGFGGDLDSKVYIPFYWSNANSKPVKLQVIKDSNFTIASGINNLGQIVGVSLKLNESSGDPDFALPIIWSNPNSKPTTLPLLDGYTIHFAKGINNLGQIVGFVSNDINNGVITPVIWATPNDKPTKLQLLEGYIGGLAAGINDLGQIVGLIIKEDKSSTGVIWTNANAKPTTFLLSFNDEFISGILISLTNIGINNVGQIAAINNNIPPLPVFFSSADANPTTLQLLAGKPYGLASGINNSGQIVGTIGNEVSPNLPVIWANANSKPVVLQVPDGYEGVVALGISGSSTTPISNICFPAGTPVQTDQGLIHIDDIDPQIHTINNQTILHITKTTTLDNYLISFDKNSLERNIPSRKTLMTKDHKIMFEGNLVPAYRFLDYSDKVKKVKYSGETLYNVLLAEYGTINVNNLMCETLHPDNIIAKLYMRELKEQPRLICQLNSSLEKKDFASYTEVVHRLTHNL